MTKGARVEDKGEVWVMHDRMNPQHPAGQKVHITQKLSRKGAGNGHGTTDNRRTKEIAQKRERRTRPG